MLFAYAFIVEKGTHAQLYAIVTV